MEQQFVVSARKYRPGTFDDVVGQEHITVTLKNAISRNHLAQAFLFCGPRGVGKTTCARILAKTINCQNLTPDIEPCNQCASCVSFNNNQSLNISELDAASNNSVDDIRNLVEQVRYPPQFGKHKVYIIDEVHMLSNAAFNAFLKTLEEPPPYAIFILATTEKHKIIPTILSRCQIFDFNRIPVPEIVGRLTHIAKAEHISADYDALYLIAQKSEGCLRDALSMFDLISTFAQGGGITLQGTLENLHILDYDYFFSITNQLLDSQIDQAFLTFDEILSKGFDAHNFVVGLQSHLRNLMVARMPNTKKLLDAPEGVSERYNLEAKKTNFNFVINALRLAADTESQLKQSKNPRLAVEILLMKLAYLPQAVNLAELSATGQLPESSSEKKK